MSRPFLDQLVGHELTDEHRWATREYCLQHGICELIKAYYKPRTKEHATDLLEFVLTHGVEPNHEAVILCVNWNFPRMLDYLLRYVENPVEVVGDITQGHYGIPIEIVEVLLGFGIEPVVFYEGKRLTVLEYVFSYFMTEVYSDQLSKVMQVFIRDLSRMCPPPDMTKLRDIQIDQLHLVRAGLDYHETNPQIVAHFRQKAMEMLMSKLDTIYNFYLS